MFQMAVLGGQQERIEESPGVNFNLLSWDGIVWQVMGCAIKGGMSGKCALLRRRWRPLCNNCTGRLYRRADLGPGKLRRARRPAGS